MQGLGRSLPSIALSVVGSIALYCLTPLTPATGQITPDDTLGAERSQVTSPVLGGFQIDGGATRGTNLSHSFREFSVPTDGFAYFNNELNIQNIMTRVTGASVSNIDGLIAANGTANVFLINPNGIIFGPNASLDVGGSFVASTASAVTFPNGIEFSATNPQTPPLLTISVPLGLQYGTNPGKIVVQGNGQGTRLTSDLIDTDFGLRVQPNQTLALVGGDVSLEGATLKTAGGRIELGSVADPGLVSLTPTDKGWALGYQGVPTLGDIQMSQQATVDASGLGGGDIQVWGRRVMLTGGSNIEASTLGEQPGGTLALNATESVEVIGRSPDGRVGSRLAAQTGASGKGGELTINTGTLLVRDGAQVGTGTFDEGDGGNLTVNADQQVEVIGRSADGRVGSRLTAQADRGSSGKAGDLTINTGTLLVRDGAQVGTGTFGQGAGGNLTINADQQVQLIGTSTNGRIPSGLFASNQPGSSGKAGDLTINTDTLLVRDGAQVNTSTFGRGDGGNLTVNADQQVEVIGTSANIQFASGLFASALPGASGKAGDLTINTGTLLVRDGAQVNTSTFGRGDGGNLTVNADQQVEVIGTSANIQFASGLGASAEPGASGKAGDLTINTGTLLVQDRALVSAATFGQGDGGNLTVNASNSVQLIGTSADGLAGSGLYASAARGASGKAGDLTINTDTLLVRDGATVTVEHPTGQAGNMTILANSVHLNQGTLSAQTAKSDAAGGANITLTGLDLLRLDNESLISTNASDLANGGNISIDSTFIIATPPTGPNGSDITANAGQGNGGAVNITTQGLFGIEFRPKLTPKNDITVTSEFGLNGSFQLTTPGVDPSRGLSNLPTEFADASNQITQNCPARGSQQESSFTITGAGGLPPRPGDAFDSPYPTGTVRSLPEAQRGQSSTNNSQVNSPPASKASPAPLVEASGWRYGANGEVILTAQAPTFTPHESWSTPPTCH